ncbi:hypothetical protein ABZZ17_25955 [Streptomyces sp. NPDC006512]|uniref:hypothetical protein n=1 Tax=Streptomyces sp. NPDC006512 TaxID=3154307 RepID=UPI0033A37801
MYVTLLPLLVALLLVVATAAVGAAALTLLLRRPAWCAPLAGAVGAMTFLLAVVALLVTVARD